MNKQLCVSLMLVALCGCAPGARITLLPDEGGGVGRIVVSTDRGSAELSQPFAAAEVSRSAVEVRASSASEVETRYGAVVKALPKIPERFTLYFQTGADQLTDESRTRIADIRRTLANFPAPEVVVIGHTDAVGSLQANDELSVKRAAVVRDILVGEGIAAAVIEIGGRGKRELAVPTADGVAEPRNRRVEVKIR